MALLTFSYLQSITVTDIMFLYTLWFIDTDGPLLHERKGFEKECIVYFSAVKHPLMEAHLIKIETLSKLVRKSK